MKLGVYFRESWHNLLADKTYGLVYILAVAFSMAMVMTYLTVQAVRMDNSYPEVHRDRMLSIPSMTFSAGQSEQGFYAEVPLRTHLWSRGLDGREDRQLHSLHNLR